MMPRGRKQATDTIPKLDRVEYLFEVLNAVDEGLAFEEMRLRLVESRLAMDRRIKADLRPESAARTRELRYPGPVIFWANTRDALRELMRLGMVVRAPVPHTAQVLDRFRAQRYGLTDEGRAFVTLGRDPGRSWEFRDRFFMAMDIAHPYLRLLRHRLREGELFIPRVGRGDIPQGPEEWLKGPPAPLDRLGEAIVTRVEAATGERIDPKPFASRLERNLQRTWAKHLREGTPGASTRWVVKTVNEQIVQTVAQTAVFTIDSIAFRYAVGLLAQLHVCWGTRTLPGRSGWSVWLTVDGDPDEQANGVPARTALDRPVWHRRRTARDDEFAEALVRAVRREARFALVHEVRAQVCHELRLHGWHFDNLLRRMVDKTVQHPDFDVHLDGGGGDELPPSEEPFLLGDRLYYLMALLPKRRLR